MDVATKAIPRNSNRLPAGGRAWSLAENEVLHYLARIPLGHTREDVMDPGYWLHVIKRLRTDMVITCVAEDGSFDFDLRVVQIGTETVAMRLIRDCPQGAMAVLSEEIGTGWRTEWKGPAQKWAIINGDGITVEKGFESKQAAAERLGKLVDDLKAAKR